MPEKTNHQIKQADEVYCSSCGKIIKKEAEICVSCGIRQKHHHYSSSPRDKTVAILLAVFLGLWAWIYTWRIDAWKFWLSLILSIFTAGIFGIAAWIWAIIDMSVRTTDFYKDY